jgi:guanylate kinase
LKIAEREMKYKERIELFDKIIVSNSLEMAYNELKNFLKKESNLLSSANNTEENRLLSSDDDQFDSSGKKFY